MKRKFINALTLSGVAFLGLAGLASCGQKVVTGVSISNKEELQSVWKYGEADRTMTFTFQGKTVDVAEALKEGSFKVVSSDTGVVSINGTTLTTTGVGSATITATYTNNDEESKDVVSDSVFVTVAKSEAEVTSVSIANKEDLQKEWKTGETNRQLEFTFEGATVNAGQAVKQGLLKLESSDSSVVSTLGTYAVPVGVGTATVTVTYTNTVGAGSKVVKDTVELTVIENASEQAAKVVTLKEFKEATISTDSDGNLVNKELYQVTAKIKGFGSKEASLSEDPSAAGSYGNMFLEDENGETLQIYGSTCTTTSLNFADGKWKFSNPKDFSNSTFGQSLKVGDEVTMLLIRCDYKTTIEGCGRFVSGPSLIDATAVDFADVISDGNVTAGAKLFSSEAEIVGFGSKEDSLTDEASGAGTYGNLYLKDSKGNTILVYGATAGDSAISWTGSKFKFTNPKDFLSNEVTSALKKGDKIKFTAIRADYNGTKEICIQSVTKVAE